MVDLSGSDDLEQIHGFRLVKPLNNSPKVWGAVPESLNPEVGLLLVFGPGRAD